MKVDHPEQQQQQQQQQGMADGGGLPRCRSVKAPSAASPLGGGAANTSTPQNKPARASTSTPTTPAYVRHKPPLSSVNCMGMVTTDTPPATPKQPQPPQRSSSSSSYYGSSMWSPRKLMQRASRAFRSGRSSSRQKKKSAMAADLGDVDSPRSVASKGSDVDNAVSFDEQQIPDDVIVVDNGQREEEEPKIEPVPVPVPEKIIHEANPSSPVSNQIQAPAPAVAEAGTEEPAVDCKNSPGPEEETVPTAPAIAAAPVEKQQEEEPKKAASAAAPAPVAVEEGDGKKEKKKKEEREEEMKAEVVRRFQMRRTASAEGRRRSSSSGNDVVEEARSKLLETMRQGNRVRALVGAFENAMVDDRRSASLNRRQPRPNVSFRV